MVVKQLKEEEADEAQRKEAKMWGRRASLDGKTLDMFESDGVRDFLGIIMEGGKKNPKVLDLACGSAKNSIFLSKNGCRVTGLDVSEDVLEVARRNCESAGVDVRLVKGDVRKIQAEDGEYDAVLGYLILDRLEGADRQDALKEMARVLKPGGAALVSGFFSYNEAQELFKYFELYPPWQPILVRGGEDKEYLRILTLRKI